MDVILDPVGVLLEIVKSYGWFIGLFVLILLIFTNYIIKNFSRWTMSTITPTVESVILDNEKILESHPFFSNAQYRVAVEIPRLELIPGKPVREKVFKDLLSISFETVYESMHHLIKFKELNEWSSEQWVDTVTQSINKMIIDTEENAKMQGIPAIVVRKFLKWHGGSIELLHEYVLLLGNAKLYNTNVSKTNTLLLIMDLLLVTILGDAERILNEINGEIVGLPYKGMTIE
ncbi:MAG: hypothetical protein JWP44_5031 [Mucilaginibacter sp.]|nr:hypothetical protein [Mucilaginibacter sp.]